MDKLIFSDKSVKYDDFCNDMARKVAYLVGKNIKEANEKAPDMVSTEEAAKILGITPDRMRHIKDRFPHIKAGGNKQGKLLFVRDSLLTSYSQYNS